MYSERRGGSKYKPKRSRAPIALNLANVVNVPNSLNQCVTIIQKKHVDVFGKNTGCVRKSRRSGRRSGRKNRKPVRNSQKTSGCGCLGIDVFQNTISKVGNMITIHLQYHGGVPNHVVADLVADRS